MRLVLDENLPHQLRHFLAGHEAFTLGYLGWKGVSNDQLLWRAGDACFGALLTMDAAMGGQQSHSERRVAVVVLHAPTNQLQDLMPLVPELLRALGRLQPRSVVHAPSTFEPT